MKQICIKCRQPEAKPNPRFCAYCGWPMAQPSPYTNPIEGKYIAIADEFGQPPERCQVTHHQLMACRQCGRLHRLTDTVCKCGHRLEEARPPFPTTRGPLDGTGNVVFRKPLLETLTPIGFARSGLIRQEILMGAVYRYGELILATQSALLHCQNDNNEWQERPGRFSFPEPAGTFRNLIVDDRWIFAQYERFTFAVSLGDSLQSELSLSEAGYKMAKGEHWWVRIVDNNGTAQAHALETQGSFGEEKQTDLKLPIDTIQDVLVWENKAAIATSKGMYLWDIRAGELRDLGGTACRWSSIAIPYRLDATGQPTAERELIAMGYDNEAHPVLSIWNFQENAPQTITLTNDHQTVFTVAGNRIYILRQHGVGIIPRTHVLQPPSKHDFEVGSICEPWLLTLSDHSGRAQMLLRRRTSQRQYLYLFAPTEGEQSTTIGTVLMKDFHWCLVDRELIVFTQDEEGILLRSIRIPETAKQK